MIAPGHQPIVRYKQHTPWCSACHGDIKNDKHHDLAIDCLPRLEREFGEVAARLAAARTALIGAMREEASRG